ncbi:MAG: sigma-70 family RNA polymerase sigma factor [Bacteroidetes bacterium]|nr:sigma-70 family RNA polymerase sigma factor [Bacteroidota bacterium]
MNKTNKIVDGWLVLQYQSGNEKALALLVKRWHKKLCSKAYWVIKDKDASKDIAQESWKTIMNKIHRLEDPNRFGSWAITIVYRKSIDFINKNKKENDKLHQYHYDKGVIANGEQIDNDDEKKAILSAVNSLPEHHQMVINLFYVEEYSLKEIGDILNISIGTVKSRLFHAREKLKAKIKYK